MGRTGGTLGVFVVFLSIAGLSNPRVVLETGRPVLWEGPAPIRYYVSSGTFAVFKNNASARAAIDEGVAAWASAMGSTSAPRIIPGQVSFAPEAYQSFAAQRNRSIYFVYDPKAVVFRRFQELHGMSRTADLSTVDAFTLFPGPTSTAAVIAFVRVDAATFRHDVAHELGHVLGLSHSITQSKSDFENQIDRASQPVMFPYAIRRAPAVYEDDRAWLAYLYPRRLPESNYRALEGVLRTIGGEPVTGVNVVAIPWGLRQLSGDPKTWSSVVSGYNGSGGAYSLPVLIGRRYQIVVESLPDDENIEFGPHIRRNGVWQVIRRRRGVTRQIVLESIFVDRDPKGAALRQDLRLTLELPPAPAGR